MLSKRAHLQQTTSIQSIQDAIEKGIDMACEIRAVVDYRLNKKTNKCQYKIKWIRKKYHRDQWNNESKLSNPKNCMSTKQRQGSCLSRTNINIDIFKYLIFKCKKLLKNYFKSF